MKFTKKCSLLIFTIVQFILVTISQADQDIPDSNVVSQIEELEVEIGENENNIKHGSKVQINWDFVDEGKKKKASPLINYAEILSIENQNYKKSIIKVLVSKRSVDFLTVAKQKGGTFSLSKGDDKSSISDMQTLYSTDPINNKKTKYFFKNGVWTQDITYVSE